MNPHSVILKEDVALDPRVYGPPVAAILGVTAVEAKMAVRRGGGIIAEQLPEDQARRLAETLEADGVGCWCVASEALPALRTPRRVTAIEATAEGLRCSLQDQREPQLLAWDQVGVVSIGLVLVPELQAEIAGVRKKDAAMVARREQEQRDLVRDRLITVVTRVDLSHEENAPAAGTHHYFFDQLRRREAMQMKAFLDVVPREGADLWRIALEESRFTDHSEDAAASGPEAPNYQAVPVLYARLKDVHTERSKKLLQGGNVERLAFPTVEEFNRYTRWWTWKERLEADPNLPLAVTAAPSGNGHVPVQVAAPEVESTSAPEQPPFRWKAPILVAILCLLIGAGAGIRFERRGAKCILCRMNRQDDVLRFYGLPVRESVGSWFVPGAKSPYDVIVGKEHEHLFAVYGFERDALFGLAREQGKLPGGNASPAEVDAAECVTGLLAWVSAKEATPEEVREMAPKLFDRVKSLADPAARRAWVELAQAKPDRAAERNLLSEINK